MKAVILAAGFGNRLQKELEQSKEYSHLRDLPKALLPIKGGSLFHRILDDILSLEDITEVCLVTNNLFYDKFIKATDGYSNIQILNDGTNSNDERLGALGDLKFALDRIGYDDEIIVAGSDMFFDFTMRDLLGYFKSQGGKLMVTPVYVPENKSDLKRLGVVSLFPDYKIIGFEEKPENPKSDYANLPLYLFPKGQLNSLKDFLTPHNQDNIGSFTKWYSERFSSYAYITKKTYDFGTLDGFIRFNDEN